MCVQDPFWSLSLRRYEDIYADMLLTRTHSYYTVVNYRRNRKQAYIMYDRVASPENSPAFVTREIHV